MLRYRSAYNSEGTLATPGIVSVMSVELDFSEICAYVSFAALVIKDAFAPIKEDRAGCEGDVER